MARLATDGRDKRLERNEGGQAAAGAPPAPTPVAATVAEHRVTTTVAGLALTSPVAEEMNGLLRQRLRRP